jgi:hypothetical protein
MNLFLQSIEIVSFTEYFRMDMKQFTQLICPISTERVDENKLRVTALGFVISMGAYFVTGSFLLIFPEAP